MLSVLEVVHGFAADMDTVPVVYIYAAADHG
jgi:hypothetical protein